MYVSGLSNIFLAVLENPCTGDYTTAMCKFIVGPMVLISVHVGRPALKIRDNPSYILECFSQGRLCISRPTIVESTPRFGR